MARKTRKHRGLILPSRQLMARFGQAFVLVFLIMLVVLGRSGNPAVSSLKMRMSDALVPLIKVASSPFEALGESSAGLKNWANAYHQNQQLKQENQQLLQWQTMAKDMQVENDKLRALLNVAPRKEAHFVTATIVSDHGSAFSSAALVDAGKEDNIATNQAVISERGLVGRVMEVGNRSAQVLLLTDVNSRIPVMNERTREKMILIGKGNNFPTLGYVTTDSAIRKGDRIITSGDGGVFPKNVPVGVVRDADKSAIQIELFANLADIEYVSIVDYNR